MNVYSYSFSISEQPDLDLARKDDHFVVEEGIDVVYYSSYSVIICVNEIVVRSVSFLQATILAQECIDLLHILGQTKIEIVGADIKHVSTVIKKYIDTKLLESIGWEKREYSDGVKWIYFPMKGKKSTFVTANSHGFNIVNAVSVAHRDYIQTSIIDAYDKKVEDMKTDRQKRVIELLKGTSGGSVY